MDIELQSSGAIELTASSRLRCAWKIRSTGGIAFTGAVAMPRRRRSIASLGDIEFTGDVSPLDRGQRLRSNGLIELNASKSRLGLARPLKSSGLIEFRANERLNQGKPELGVGDVILEMFLIWGMERLCGSPTYLRRKAINDLNAALQIIWNRAEDRNYWTARTIEIVFAEGEDEKVLPTNVQNVIGPARTDDGPLVPVGSSSEMENAELFGISATEPFLYHVSRERAESGKDPAYTSLKIYPAATESTTIRLDVVLESPRYLWIDAERNTSLPLPHRYTETLLLPILKYYAITHYLSQIREDSQKEFIVAEYQRVATLLGLADPLPGKAGDNINRRKEEAI